MTQQQTHHPQTGQMNGHPHQPQADQMNGHPQPPLTPPGMPPGGYNYPPRAFVIPNPWPANLDPASFSAGLTVGIFAGLVIGGVIIMARERD